MSGSEPNEAPGAEAARSYRELATLVRHLAEQLAGFRRRAFAAEARLREIDLRAATSGAEAAAAAAAAAASAPVPVAADPGRLAELERENADLRRRLEQAGSRTRQLLERVRFLRQQHVAGGSP